MTIKKPVKKSLIVLVRCRNAGVHFGTLISRKGTEVKLGDSRRIWYWDGAASLSELAVYGTKKPGNCKLSVEVKAIEVLDACEIIVCHADAIKSIKGVSPWRA